MTNYLRIEYGKRNNETLLDAKIRAYNQVQKTLNQVMDAYNANSELLPFNGAIIRQALLDRRDALVLIIQREYPEWDMQYDETIDMDIHWDEWACSIIRDNFDE